MKSQLEPMAPKDLSADHMLADILVMYAPVDFLKREIKGADFISSADGTRRIVQSGKDLIVVTRPPHAPSNLWLGRATLENKAFDYRLSIESQAL